MYGDFTRGHAPDRVRGRDYRRVLLLQGRPVLDSDVAARVDSLLGQVESSTRALGCRAGSTDLGFLVTPGQLVTIFSQVRDGLEVLEGVPDAWVDFRYRFAQRYPALHLAAPAGLVRVQVPATRALVAGPGDVQLTLWARVTAATTITVNGINVPLAPVGGDAPVPFTFTASGTTSGPIELGLASGEVWLYLLEQFQPIGQFGAFAVAAGSYQLDGLIAQTSGGAFPDVTFPAADGFDWQPSPPQTTLPGLTWTPAIGDRAVAYLEVWERVITAVEDPGIHEVALGRTDTCVRTQLVGQVKLAKVSNTVPEATQVTQILDAFRNVEVSGGQLQLSVPVSAATPDPCALPEAQGYAGDDNRLYRIEVHRGGSLAQLLLKWSRDNAGELFPAELSQTGELVLPGATSLASGDVVEVLSDVIDLGDEVYATVAPGGFIPSQRAVGQLGQLVEVPSQAGDDTVRFQLAEVNNASEPVEVDSQRYGDLTKARLKLRRWHGVLDLQHPAGPPAPIGGPYVLEDGITVTMDGTGTYRPGQYWQYQARPGVALPQPWQPSPHGPSRWFAPLALLRVASTSPPHPVEDSPWELVAWLDERFDRLCELEADGVAFDNDRVDTDSDTVQEALEELYERGGGHGGCRATVGRGGDYQTLARALGDLAQGDDSHVCICLLPGEHPYGGMVEQRMASLNIEGCGAVLRLTYPPFFAPNITEVTLSGFEVVGKMAFEECDNVYLERLRVSTDADDDAALVLVKACKNIRIRDCEFTATVDPGTGIPRAALQIEALAKGGVWISGNHLTGGLALHGEVQPEKIQSIELRRADIVKLARTKPPRVRPTGDTRLDLHQNTLSWILLSDDPDRVDAFESVRVSGNVLRGVPRPQDVIDAGLAEIAAGQISFSGNDIQRRIPRNKAESSIAGVIYTNHHTTATANTCIPKAFRFQNDPYLVLSVAYPDPTAADPSVTIPGIRAAAANVGIEVIPPVGGPGL